MARKKRSASTTRRMHRTFGAGAAVFIILMVVSGMVLNHANSLGLDQRHVSQSMLLDWYGLAGPEQIKSYPVGENWLSFAGSQLYLNEMQVSSISNGVGAVLSGEMLIAAGSDELLLLDGTGNLVERQPWGPQGAEPIDSIGSLPDGSIILRSRHQLWQSDTDLLSWNQLDNEPINPSWSLPKNTPPNLHQSITRQYRGEGLNLERVLLDLHSGRIFGSAGLLVYDLLALLLGFLAVSGLIMWFRGRRNGKQKPSRTTRP